MSDHGSIISFLEHTGLALRQLSAADIVVPDGKMALIFDADPLCCIAVIGLAAHERAKGPVRLTLMDGARLRARKM